MTFAYKTTMVSGVEIEFRDCLKIKSQFRRVARVGCRAVGSRFMRLHHSAD